MMKSPKVLGNYQRRCQKNVILWAGRQEQELMILQGLILQLLTSNQQMDLKTFAYLFFSLNQWSS
ncbi:MAG: hypothetical protein CMD86_00005, partial [Gammaproteobacteria bacterium]|nr:hypothetical protein [Gammaproteobacteria bacterium]